MITPRIISDKLAAGVGLEKVIDRNIVVPSELREIASIDYAEKGCVTATVSKCKKRIVLNCQFTIICIRRSEIFLCFLNKSLRRGADI